MLLYAPGSVSCSLRYFTETDFYASMLSKSGSTRRRLDRRTKVGFVLLGSP